MYFILRCQMRENISTRKESLIQKFSPILMIFLPLVPDSIKSILIKKFLLRLVFHGEKCKIRLSKKRQKKTDVSQFFLFSRKDETKSQNHGDIMIPEVSVHLTLIYALGFFSRPRCYHMMCRKLRSPEN